MIIREYREGDYVVREYESGAVVRIPYSEPSEPIEPQPIEPQSSLHEIAEETLLETKYQTALLELMLF